MDRITAVDVFLRTIACGSISGAANELDMSRSMATRYIAAQAGRGQISHLCRAAVSGGARYARLHRGFKRAQLPDL